MGAVYYWIPKWSGHMYSEFWGKMHFWLSMIFVNLLFFPMHFLGLAGMPRRTADYALQFTGMNEIVSIGAFGFGAAQLIFLGIIIAAARGRKNATAQVWEGARGLEWTLPSPAPYHSFETAPEVD
jgi:cytochrome c oxidase subunit 1